MPTLLKDRKPYACVDCGSTIPARSKYYDEGVCWRCVRRDSRGGVYRDRFNYRVRGLTCHRDNKGRATSRG